MFELKFSILFSNCLRNLKYSVYSEKRRRSGLIQFLNDQQDKDDSRE